ncbi:MAG: phosphatase PAP2 family protein [Planctomycetota bacterium]|nr:phosphatase PAP2 family protein [Planctomycetota bacterium]MCX8005021.1 phosphatase PAP2 family protein [Burkholderiaceae bacterium]MDW8372618.1 phosphatase PAP2 family protein [Planctomycetota bacterium]
MRWLRAWRAAVVREGEWILRNLWALLCATGGEARRRPWLTTALLAGGVALTALSGLWDGALSEWARARADWNDPVHRAARFWRTFGAFTDVLTWTALLLCAGRLLGRERWCRLGLACLLAASLAGLTANLFRPTIGRARPDTEAGVWALRGPVFSARWQSLPSGHSATSIGGGAALAFCASPFALVALPNGLLVAASSVYLNRHWLSDAVGGLGLGLTAGVLVGLGFRRLERAGGWVGRS